MIAVNPFGFDLIGITPLLAEPPAAQIDLKADYAREYAIWLARAMANYKPSMPPPPRWICDWFDAYADQDEMERRW